MYIYIQLYYIYVFEYNMIYHDMVPRKLRRSEAKFLVTHGVPPEEGQVAGLQTDFCPAMVPIYVMSCNVMLCYFVIYIYVCMCIYIYMYVYIYIYTYYKYVYIYTHTHSSIERNQWTFHLPFWWWPTKSYLVICFCFPPPDNGCALRHGGTSLLSTSWPLVDSCHGLGVGNGTWHILGHRDHMSCFSLITILDRKHQDQHWRTCIPQVLLGSAFYPQVGVSSARVLMASMQSEQHISWRTLTKNRSLSKFMSAVNQNPDSFDLFVRRSRRYSYPDVGGTVAAIPDIEPDAADCHASLSCRLMLQPSPIRASKECHRHKISLWSAWSEAGRDS